MQGFVIHRVIKQDVVDLDAETAMQVLPVVDAGQVEGGQYGLQVGHGTLKPAAWHCLEV